MKAFIYLFFLLTLTACVNPPIGRSYAHIPDEGWQKTDTVELPVTVDSVTYARVSIGTAWDVWVDVRHTNAYPYRNLVVELVTPRQDTIVNLSLTDEQGRWAGSGLGYLYQHSHYAGMFHPDSTGADTLYFRLISLMPDSTLKGVHDIGIRLLPR